MKQLRQGDVRAVRNQIWLDQSNRCLICNEILEEHETNLDHCHDSGLIRGVLCRGCNSAEGRIRGIWKRMGLSKVIKFEDFLRNLYYYLNKEPYNLLHPSVSPKKPKLQKRSYNSLVNAINVRNAVSNKKITIPKYNQKTKRCTKKMCELFEFFGLKPKFYSK